MEQHSFGHWLRLKRKALDLTREQLAERVGYSAATIRKIEDEERHPSEQVVERLAEIFNIPQNERTVFLQFARGGWKSAPAQSVEEVPWRASTKSTPSNLPATTTSLIGREKEIAHLHNDLLKADIRLVTLLGPPGIGKTRLGIETARALLSDFPDGVFFVALAPLSDPGLIAPTITQTLGFVEIKSQSPLERLKDGIGGKQMLLILDNAEHLIEGVATLVSDLLSICPRLKILTTSREALRVSGEWLYSVPSLRVPKEILSADAEVESQFSALTLFEERARAVRSDFSLNADNIETVAAICAHLDGLPLVIELIAARMRLMTPQTLLARLSGQFVLTADGMRAASERQKTLQNAIDWSYKLLPPEEQKLFAYLSVFSSSFTLDATEAMFSQKVTEKPLPNLIALLLDKSLLKLTPDVEAKGEARYTMLVTIQEFARERLQEMGEETEIRNAHLAYFLELAKQGGHGMRGPNQVEWLHRLTAARDNLSAALDWAIEIKQTEVVLQLVRKLHWFWFVHSDHNEARRALGRALALPDVRNYPESQAEALTQLAHHIWTQIGAAEARPPVEQALSIARTHDDKQNIARSLCILGLVLIMERNFAEAQSNLEESKALFQEVGDKWEYAHAVMSLALEAHEQNELALSLSLHEQALALFREVGGAYFQSFALDFIGILQVKQGDMKRGMTALREALILARRLDSKHGIAGAISRLAAVAQRAGDPVRAVLLYWAAKNVWGSIGVWREADEIDFENWLAPCHASLSEAEFKDATEQGRAMTMEQAIAYALEYSDE
jgi:predicted ATPase/transcriptional regulator with XRE-family HTH domain